MVTGDGYMTRPHRIISSGILDTHIQLVMQILKIEIVVLCSIAIVEHGLFFAHKTSLIPPLFIEVSVSRRVRGRVFVCEGYL
jgi:hypothetical protein